MAHRSRRGGNLRIRRGRGANNPRPHRRLGGRVPCCRNMVQINGEWASWESLSVTLSGLPTDIDTFTVWKSFSAHGTVDYIELFEDARGRRERRGIVRYRPPPQEPFWLRPFRLELRDGEVASLNVHLDMQRPALWINSPIQPGVRYPTATELPAMWVEFGTMLGEKSFLPLRTFDVRGNKGIHLVVDVSCRDLSIYVYVPILSVTHNHGPSFFRFRVPFFQLSTILKEEQPEGFSLVVPLNSPASCHRQAKFLTDAHFPPDENAWNSKDTWSRQTDIVHYPENRAPTPTNLRKQNSYINFGRWTTFRIGFNQYAVHDGNKLDIITNIFKDFNINFQAADGFEVIKKTEPIPTVWKWIDTLSTHRSGPISSLEALADSEYTPLEFAVRYYLEVCISYRYLNEYAIKKKFVDELARIGEKKAKYLLEYVDSNKIAYYDPMNIFNIRVPNFPDRANNTRTPVGCCYMRSAEVTPSTIYYKPPSIDTGNRVLRRYREYADRFLHVRFTDEKNMGKIFPYSNANIVCMNEVYTRVTLTMKNGITIGDRCYEFLAFSNAQLREHAAYFFASLPHLTAANIRAQLGKFNQIRNVAKHAARLGQCFSSTRALNGCPVQIVEIDDIERNGYTFSDGVGLISTFLAQMIQSEFAIETLSGEPPSVFQFRLGGCKGILTVSSKAHRREVHIRKSQYKFAAPHNGLEIIRHSSFCFASLNRQLIIVLSSLGIPDEIFVKKLQVMLENLELAMTSQEQAVNLLQTYVDPNQMTLVLADMVLDGFQQSQDPFVTSLLELWRVWQIKYLKAKAKIAIDKGAFLLGCLDETGSLKGYFRSKRPGGGATYEQKLDCLPEIFVQISRHSEDTYEVIEGLCILARNPSLHPGDIRVVKAVDIPDLHHLKDVVVLPQTGDRDIASMCSGGDLDGDDYVVIWDQDLLPKDWFEEPMDYSAPKSEVLDRDVTVDDIIKFFVSYMQNDRLPQIAPAHLAIADYSDDGVQDEKCLRLATLHSAAVDYNKSGMPVHMNRDLKPKKWPHFMERKFAKKDSQYTSRKILGQLYDIAGGVYLNLQPHSAKRRLPFDQRILNANFEIDDKLLSFAKELKAEYDADIRRIMAQHEIQSEEEVWSTFVLSHANMSKDYKFHEEIGLISSALRQKFRMLCHEKAGGKDFKSLAPLAVAMYRVTSEQMEKAKAAHSHCTLGEEQRMPLISFPWVLQPILGMIVTQHFHKSGSEGLSGHIQAEILHGSKQRKNVANVCALGVETAKEVKGAANVLLLFEDSKFDPFASLAEAFDTPQISPERKENQTTAAYSDIWVKWVFLCFSTVIT
ncbi:hypothetical protein PAAG_03813 [Paracoccidioides lutzii Pb01]|uniref:RNA-dependent RNA polymerase n=1 Tax=Paracoccidioides lutzii (strain ATCC MYA-826 / Pb01) TaxID=502779 RepID=C1GZ69_PARBA|nr:hypothetical protein PAAG_03813 [Paracoccidioides lutzii Pb01]EEH41892.2 hypothetical protein PAAG_03813 [Paracoccidioides lutzii Pb01]